MKLDREVLDLVLSYIAAEGLHKVNKGMSFNQQFALAYAAGKGIKWISDNYGQTILDFLEDMAIANATRDARKVQENRAKRIARRILDDNKV